MQPHSTPSHAPESTCPECREPFTKTRSTQVFCSPSCYSRDYRRRNKERLAAREAQRYAEKREEYKARARDRYLANKEHLIAQNRARYRLNRDRYIATNRRYQAVNREEIRKQRRGYYQRKAAETIARASAWNRQNARRRAAILRRREAQKRGAGVAQLTHQEWDAIKSAFDYRCAYCGERPDLLTQDHVIPLSKGGSHTADNVVPACQPCNSRKGTGPAPAFVVQPREGDGRE